MFVCFLISKEEKLKTINAGTKSRTVFESALISKHSYGETFSILCHFFPVF